MCYLFVYLFIVSPCLLHEIINRESTQPNVQKNHSLPRIRYAKNMEQDEQFRIKSSNSNGLLYFQSVFPLSTLFHFFRTIRQSMYYCKSRRKTAAQGGRTASVRGCVNLQNCSRMEILKRMKTFQWLETFKLRYSEVSGEMAE